MLSTKLGISLGVSFFVLLWIVLFVYHEYHSSRQPPQTVHDKTGGGNIRRGIVPESRGNPQSEAVSFRKSKVNGQVVTKEKSNGRIKFNLDTLESVVDHQHKVAEEHDDGKQDLLNEGDLKDAHKRQYNAKKVSEVIDKHVAPVESNVGASVDSHFTLTSQWFDASLYRHGAKRGVLMCKGNQVDSEIIYWKIVPGDGEYESPITPHHGLHNDRYLSFEYDNGGWNNVRMGMEALIVVAHATGRTLVVPPQQHLYLLGQNHKDEHDQKAHDEMGFEDFFDIDLLRSHKGFHILHMEEFLEKEAVTGGLHGKLPPNNSTKVWGAQLWSYLNKVADAKPEWMGRFIAFPHDSRDFNMSKALLNETVAKRMQEFGGERSPVFYDEQLMEAHHIHFPAHERHRLLQHHYAFAFFSDPTMQSFYRRFVRDYMRYKDNIQCAGAELVAAVRADAKKLAPEQNGDYYALHIRRGDFQYKDVKISAQEIIDNLHFQNNTPIIPPGSVVYVSTDDPDGVCLNCYVQRKPCTSYETPKPVGCPEDTSWNAFVKFGWKIRFLRDYQKAGYLKDVNPNTYGMVESIVCSRAKVFAGTYFSTFTGYIHRLRGYHGLGESTYYHHKHYVFYLQKQKSIGHGFSREWRSGWTDDGGQLI